MFIESRGTRMDLRPFTGAARKRMKTKKARTVIRAFGGEQIYCLVCLLV